MIQFWTACGVHEQTQYCRNFLSEFRFQNTYRIEFRRRDIEDIVGYESAAGESRTRIERLSKFDDWKSSIAASSNLSDIHFEVLLYC